MAECKSCHAPIVWVLTRTGKRMPIDQEPNPAGNVVLRRQPDATVIAQVVAGATLDVIRAEGARLYMPHHAVCPTASQHRRKP